MDFGNVGWKNPFTGYQPGEVYDVNKQCQLVFGRGYIFEWVIIYFVQDAVNLST